MLELVGFETPELGYGFYFFPLCSLAAYRLIIERSSQDNRARSFWIGGKSAKKAMYIFSLYLVSFFFSSRTLLNFIVLIICRILDFLVIQLFKIMVDLFLPDDLYISFSCLSMSARASQQCYLEPLNT